MAPFGVCHCNIIPFTATSKLFVSSLFLLLTLPLAAVDGFTGAFECDHKDLISGSARETNLNVVQSSFVGNVNKTGYSISSHGENGDRAYGLAQCRGDLDASTCRACVDNAVKVFADYCGNYSSRSIYLNEGCFLRFETYNFYSKLSKTSFDNCSSISSNSTDPKSSFLWPVARLLTTAVNNAVASNVAYGTEIDGGNYSLAQCWRDLSMDDCTKCLNSVYNNFQTCLQGSLQSVAVSENCMIRYETYKFFGHAVLLPSPPGGGRGPSLPPSPSNGRAPPLPSSPSNGSGPSMPPSRDTKGKRQLGSVMAGVVVMMVLVSVLVVAWKRKVIRRWYKKQPPGTTLACYLQKRRNCVAIEKDPLQGNFIQQRINALQFLPDEMQEIGLRKWDFNESRVAKKAKEPQPPLHGMFGKTYIGRFVDIKDPLEEEITQKEAENIVEDDNDETLEDEEFG